MTPIERVAKAIKNAEFGCNWEAMAVAAVEAMREPSKKMAQAGNDALDWESSDVNGRWYIVSADEYKIWRAMIAAALAEGDGK